MTSFTTTPQRPAHLRASTAQDYLARMSRLQRYISEHLDDEHLDPDALAQVACMSRAHFHRVFRAMFGESIMEHLRRLRLERAAQRLRFQRGQTILELAVEAGYSSHEAFTRAFAARFGTSPSDYRLQPSARVLEAHQPQLPQVQLDVELRDIAPIEVMMIRHWGPYIGVSPTFERLAGWAGERARRIGQAPEFYGCYHDDPEITPPARRRADLSVVMKDRADRVADGEVVPGTIAGGTYAVLVHRGPYETLSESYIELIGRWLPGSGYALCPEGVVEAYLNSPHTVAQQDLLTEVRVRLQPA